LSELIVRWFGLPGGNAFDCFAGDTIFGWVAGFLGQNFTGIELRAEQADINNQRVSGANLTARYVCDDGQNVASHLDPESQDLFFSCPPYFNLEKYSDMQNDASNQASYGDFLKIMRNAFTGSVRCLKENRFAVVVVGDIRDEQGYYRGLPEHIKAIFIDAGMKLYNEMILVESIGSARLRAKKNMDNRKITKTHQNVLVFFKGDPKQIKSIYPEIEIDYEGEGLEN
jgi:DNA modification methylase